MDCHINCHGELNALLLTIPFATYAIARVRAAWRNRFKKPEAPNKETQ